MGQRFFKNKILKISWNLILTELIFMELIQVFNSKSFTITLVGSSNDPPSEKFREPILHYTIYYYILGNKKRPKDQSRIVKTGGKWSKLVKTGGKWSKLVKTGNDLHRSWDFYLNISEPNFSSIWSFTKKTIVHILWKSDNSEYFYFPL